MPRVLIDQDIQPRSRLLSELPCDIAPTVGVEGNEDELIAALDRCDALFATSRLPVTARVLEETSLEAVGKLGTGVDNIDLTAAKAEGVPVTHTPGINALSVAEHALGLALAALRRTTSCQDTLREGGWRDETPIGTQLSGGSVGIVGFGDIGSRFASLLLGFGVDVLVYDPYVQPEDTELTGAELVSLDALLSKADLVSVNAELTDETRGLLGRAEFERMKSSATVVNTARGPIIEQDALVSALEGGDIASAGLDVFEEEPLDSSSPLHELDNVVLTPHVAARTKTASVKCIDRLVENVGRLLAGEEVPERYLAAAKS